MKKITEYLITSKQPKQETLTPQEETEQDFKDIVDILEKDSLIKRVYANFDTRWGDYTSQYIKLDALDPKDWPNNIAMNSVYLQFHIDFGGKSIELKSEGHIWLSPADKETPKYKYFAMKSMEQVYMDMGGKKFRKSKFKSPQEAAKKMLDYYHEVMKAVDKYTGGYPYKEGR